MRHIIHLTLLPILVALLLGLAGPSAAQPVDPLEEILGITEKEEELPSPEEAVALPEVTTVTATNPNFEVQLAIPSVFEVPEDAVRVIAKRISDGTAERYLHVKVTIYYGPDYYTWENYENLRMTPGEESRTEIAYSVRKVDEDSLVRVTLADLDQDYVEFPAQNIFFVAALRPGEDGPAIETWSPEIRTEGPFDFHFAPHLMSDAEFERLSERYLEAKAKLEAIWQELPRPRTSVYLFDTEATKGTFLLHDDELTQYPDAIMDVRGEDGEWSEPAEKLSWVSSIYLGDPPPLFHDALALMLQEDPEIDGRPLREFLLDHRRDGNLYSLDTLLVYEGDDPEDATRTVGVPQLASVVRFLLEQKNPDAFREAFILMMRGDWIQHNESVLQGIYDMDLETMETEWKAWLTGNTAAGTVPSATGTDSLPAGDVSPGTGGE